LFKGYCSGIYYNFNFLNPVDLIIYAKNTEDAS